MGCISSKHGIIIWIYDNARAVPDDRVKLLYYKGFVVDITEHKGTEEQLRYNRHHDALTVFGKGVGFIERVKKALSFDDFLLLFS